LAERRQTRDCAPPRRCRRRCQPLTWPAPAHTPAPHLAGMPF